MKCFICGEEMQPCFEKNFGLKNLDKCEYVRCPNCKLIIAKTIYELPEKQWEAINYEVHNSVFMNEIISCTDIDPTVYERFEISADFFNELLKHGIFKADWKTVDYGAGNGALADTTNKKMGMPWLKKFDAYMKPFGENYLPADEIKPGNFDFVVTTSVFEHLLGNRGDVDKVMGLLNSNGVMGLNLFVCEEMPDDPRWFYYMPVHCTFWTNKAMSILYKKSGFKGCVYNVEACMWIMFRDEKAFEKLESIADKFQQWKLVFSKDFVDYWKIQPKVKDFKVDTEKFEAILKTYQSRKNL